MKITKMVVPIDFSTCSMLLVREAAELAVSVGATMTLLHVAELPAGLAAGARIHPDGPEVTAEEYVAQDAANRVQSFLELARSLGADAKVAVRVGAVVPQILAEAEGADLVVMGTHGRSGLARAVLGSVAEQVVRAGRVPVMLVRRQVRPECAHASCNWCHEGVHSPAEDRVEAEMQG